MYGLILLGLGPGATPAQEPPPLAYLDHAHAGHVALESGDLAAAAVSFEAALEAEPDAAGCAYALACVAARAGDADGATRWLTRAIDLGWRDAALARWDTDLAGLEDLERILDTIPVDPTGEEPEIELLFAPSMRPHALSPDGKRLVTGFGPHAFLWDARTGELLHAIPAARRRITCAAFTPDSEHLVIAGIDRRIGVYDARTGEHEHDLDSLIHSMSSMRITPDSAFVILQDGVRERRRPLKEVAAFSRRVLATSPNGAHQLTTQVGNAQIVSLRGTLARDALGEFNTPYAAFGEVGFSSDSRYAWLLDRQGHVFVLRTSDGAEIGRGPEEVDDFGDVHAPPRGACVYGERDLLVTWDHAGLRGFDLPTGEFVRPSEEARPGSYLHASPDGRYFLSGSWQEPARLISGLDGAVLWRDPPGTPRVQHALFSADGSELFVMRLQERIEVLDTRTGRLVRTIGGRVVRVAGPRFLPDDRTVVVEGSDGFVRLFDAATGIEKQRLRGNTERVTISRWTLDGRTLATGGEDRKARLFDLATGALLFTLDAFPSEGYAGLQDLAFDADGKRLLAYASGVGDARVWSVETGAVDLDLDRTVTHAVWSPDGTQLAVSNGETLRILDARSGAELGSPMLHDTKIASIAYAPSGNYVVTGSNDESLNVWDVETTTRTHAVRHSGDFIFGLRVPVLRFTTGGKRLVSTTSAFGTVQCWDTETWDSPWQVDYGGGNPSSLLVSFDASGERAYLSGMIARNTRVVSMQDGKTLFDLAERNVFNLSGSSDGAFAVAAAVGGETYRTDSTVVFDGRAMQERYARTELEPGGLLHTPHGYCAGSPAALRASWVSIDGEIVPLERRASLLFDPRRVRAAAAGVELEAPRIP